MLFVELVSVNKLPLLVTVCWSIRIFYMIDQRLGSYAY